MDVDIYQGWFVVQFFYWVVLVLVLQVDDVVVLVCVFEYVVFVEIDLVVVVLVEVDFVVLLDVLVEVMYQVLVVQYVEWVGMGDEGMYVVVCGVQYDFFWFVVLDDLVVFYDCDVGVDFQCFVEVVVDEYDGFVQLLLQYQQFVL